MNPTPNSCAASTYAGLSTSTTRCWLAGLHFLPFFQKNWNILDGHTCTCTYNFIHVHVALFPEFPPANALVTFELTRIFSCEGVQRLSVLVHKIGEPWDEANVNINCHVQLYMYIQ